MKLAFIFLLSYSLFASDVIITDVKLRDTPQMIEGEEYGPFSPEIYYEFFDGEVDGVLSGTVAIGAKYMINIVFTNCDTNKQYAIYSTPELNNWRTPWTRFSPWFTNISGTNFMRSFIEEQRFFKVVEQ